MWSVIVDAGSYLQFLRLAILKSSGLLCWQYIAGHDIKGTGNYHSCYSNKTDCTDRPREMLGSLSVVIEPLLGNELFNNKQSINQIEI